MLFLEPSMGAAPADDPVGYCDQEEVPWVDHAHGGRWFSTG